MKAYSQICTCTDFLSYRQKSNGGKFLFFLFVDFRERKAKF